MLRDGGNAADAAVATILALSVTDANQFCFGGEVPILVYDATRKVVEVACRAGRAPRLATREHFAKHGGIPASGIEAAAVPATLDACLTALDRYGTRTFAQVGGAGAADPRPGRAALARRPGRTIRRLVEAESVAGDRRRGLRLVADYFYRGPIAREIDAWSRANGGLIRYDDLATHVTRIEEPVTVDYRGYTVAKCGPWTQGPSLLEALAAPRRVRPGGDGAQPARRDPRHGRGDQAGLRRPRRLLRRSALRGCARSTSCSRRAMPRCGAT